MAGRIALIGAPTDINSSFMRGPAKAPPVIRAMLHSAKGNSSTELGGAIGAEIDLVDLGDLALDETGADDLRIEAAVAGICATGDIPLVLGGDHSISLPILKAIAAHHGPVEILHIDAHPDLYDELDGNRRSHATPFARIMEAGLAKRLVQVGIRTLNPHQREQAAKFGAEIVSMRDFTVDKVPEMRGPLYISIDIDGIDPGEAPGVSHHEPGGLRVREVIDILNRLKAPIVGIDVVEFNPVRDVQEMTASVAAKLVKELAALATRNRATI
jgi:arginase